ncbi:MAG: cell wall-binding repeat-containing protein [Faecousia sp.]
MKRIQKWTAFFLALALIVGLGPLPAKAVENAPASISFTYINPLYADVITEADLTPPRQPGVSTYEAQKYVTTIKEAGQVIRDGMKERQETIVVYYQMPQESYSEADFKATLGQIADHALVHTGVPTEGDYLSWQYGGWECSGEAQRGEADGVAVYLWTITYTYTYYTTADQEQKMDEAVEALLEDLGVSSATDYQKLCAIYDYICENVTYDHDNLENDDYKLKYTAYAALMNGTAVCQGYAVLLYRLALELGVDARLIPGTASNGEAHGWNIAQLHSLYYDLDSTWDAGETDYDYFLKCDVNFTGHTRYEDYATEAFYVEYPMSDKDFVPTADDTTCTAHNYKGKVTTEATCTAKGVKTYTCTICGDTYTEDIPATEHSWDDGIVTKEPTETETGIRTYTCTVCKATKTEDIPVKEHTHSYTAVTTDPTCTEQGYTTYTCTCGDSYKDDYVDALGHDLVNPTYDSSTKTHTFSCSRCDYTETEDCTFGEGEIITEATEETPGEKKFTCSVCKGSYTEEIPVKEHEHRYTTVTTDPTCTEQGYTTHTCTCGYSYKDDYVDALGHNLVNPTYDSSTKTHTFSCSRCDYTETEDCTFDEGKVITEATEETPGEKEFTCSVCGGTYTEEIPVKGHEHRYTTVTTDPTCTEQGYTTYTCACGDSYKDDYVDALGHDLGNPTYDSSTKAHTFSCSRCDYTKTEDCTFDDGKVITEATEDAPGEKEYTCSVCGGTYTEEFAYVPPEAVSVTRISGKTRVDTAMAIADEMKKELGVDTFETILVANGGSFPDALAGSYLAIQKDAPILLALNTEDTTVNDKVLDYIEKNLRSDGTVYILGGTASVSKTFADGLEEAGIAYKRLSGKNRYDTSLKILEEAGLNGKQILVCTGENYADALSVSAVNKPILLVNGKEKKLTDAQKKYLEALGDGYTFYIVGGTGAVSAELEEALAAYGSVERISGKGRHETSVAVAEKFFGDVDCAALAYSMNYPDGLCGGPLAYKLGAPLLLVKSDNEAPAAEYVKANNIKRGIVFGGTAGITDEAARTVFGLPEDAEISKSNA